MALALPPSLAAFMGATLQAAPRPGWYDWPWGAVGAIAILVGLIVWLLRMVLTDYFAKPSQLRELRDTLVAERTELKAALEADIEELKMALTEYEHRCDHRTTRFEERLEKGFATIPMLNGVGDRVTVVADRVTGVTTLFTQTRDRADEAYEISRDLRKDLEHFMGRVEEKLRPVEHIGAEMRKIDGKLETLTNVLSELQKHLLARPIT